MAVMCVCEGGSRLLRLTAARVRTSRRLGRPRRSRSSQSTCVCQLAASYIVGHVPTWWKCRTVDVAGTASSFAARRGVGVYAEMRGVWITDLDPQRT